MKRGILPILTLCAALLTLSCEKEESFGPGEGAVTVSLTDLASRAVSTAGQTIGDCTLSIYERTAASEQPTLIRRYAPGSTPERIKLLAGDYTAAVQWGEAPDVAALDKCRYEGAADFAVAAGATTSVTVSCYPLSAAVQVLFEMLVDEIADPQVTLELTDAPAGAAVTSLCYTQDDTGYFTVPEEGGEVAWTFRAEHAVKGPVEKQGSLRVEGGKKYTLTYRYSADLPGYIYVELVEIDLRESGVSNDVFVFSALPEIELGFAQGGSEEFAGEELALAMKATGNATIHDGAIYLVAADGSTTKLWSWLDNAGEHPDVEAGLTEADKQLLVTLHPDFFAGRVGDCLLRFEVTDTNRVTEYKEATVRIEGLFPVTDADFDLWQNRLSARVLSLHGAPEFRLREEGSETWRTVKPVDEGNGFYTANFEAEWKKTYNEAAQADVYRATAGIYANKVYELVATVGDQTYRSTFDTACDQPIPGLDSSTRWYSTNNERDQQGPEDFWGSGNNSFAKDLCTPAEKDGLYSAYLEAKMAGFLGINRLASGNFFSGAFERPSTTGTVYFGKDYDWQARPTALHVKYQAEIGTVTAQQHKLANGSHPLNVGDPDISVIYVAIVDWRAPHEVASGTSAPTGMWSPDETTDPGEGPVIGYGIVRLTESTPAGWQDLEIPLYFYDTTAKPTRPYKIVISSSTCYYGDYMCGCENNKMWLTDFSWVY